MTSIKFFRPLVLSLLFLIRLWKGCTHLLQQIQLIYHIPVPYNFFILYSIEIYRSYVYLFVCWWPSLEFFFMRPNPIKEHYHKIIFSNYVFYVCMAIRKAVKNSLKNCLNPLSLVLPNILQY